MKRFIANSLVILSGIALLNPDSARAAIVIDNFTDVNLTDGQQFVNRGGPTTGIFAVPQIAISEQPGTGDPAFSGVLGGYRDLWLQGVAGTTTATARTATGSVADGTLSFSNGTGVQSWLNVTWDGDDSGANLGNPSAVGTPSSPGTFADTATDLRRVIRGGLGTRDLTDGGRLNAIALELITADLGINIELTVYDILCTVAT